VLLTHLDIITAGELSELFDSHLHVSQFAAEEINTVYQVVRSVSWYNDAGEPVTWWQRIAEVIGSDRNRVYTVRQAWIFLYVQARTKLDFINQGLGDAGPRTDYEQYIADYERLRFPLSIEDKQIMRRTYRESLVIPSKPVKESLPLRSESVVEDDDIDPSDPVGRERHYAEIDSGNRYQVAEPGYCFPGTGYSYEGCNDWTYIKGCTSDLHQESDQFRGQSYTKRVKYYCGRISCPKCYQNAISRLAVRVSNRVECAIVKHNSVCDESRRAVKPLHVIYSFAKRHYDALSTDDGLKRLEKKMRVHLKECGVIGGVVIYHPFRFNEGVPYFSPHFHIIALGYLDMDRIVAVNRRTRLDPNDKTSGDVIKMVKFKHGNRNSYTINDPLHVRSLVAYALSHAGIPDKGHSVTYFGSLSYNQLHVRSVLEHARESSELLSKGIQSITDYVSYFSDKHKAIRQGSRLKLIATVTEYTNKEDPQFGDHGQYERVLKSANISNWHEMIDFKREIDDFFYGQLKDYPVFQPTKPEDEEESTPNRFLSLQLTGELSKPRPIPVTQITRRVFSSRDAINSLNVNGDVKRITVGRENVRRYTRFHSDAVSSLYYIKRSTHFTKNLMVIMSQSTDNLCKICRQKLRILVPIDRNDVSSVLDLPVDVGVVVDNNIYEESTYHDPRGKILFDGKGRLKFATKIGVLPEYFSRRPQSRQKQILDDIKMSVERYEQIEQSVIVQEMQDEENHRIMWHVSDADVLGRHPDPRMQESMIFE